MASISRIRSVALPVFRKFNVARAGLFGSVARGEAKKASDIDILVELDNSFSIFKLVELKQELEKSLRRKVDLVEYSTIKPALSGNILGSEVRIYEKAG